MDKAEFIVTKYYCHLKCEPQEEKCKDCELLKIYREIYDEFEKQLTDNHDTRAETTS